MTKEREEFNGKVEDLKKNFIRLRYIKAMYEQHCTYITTNICDEKTEQLNCMNRYKHFFHYSGKNAFTSTVIELSKFFDKDNAHNETLSIFFLLKKAEKITDSNKQEKEKIIFFTDMLQETPETQKTLKNLRIALKKQVCGT